MRLFLILALFLPSCGIAEMARDVSAKYEALKPQIEQAKGVIQAAGPMLDLVKDFVNEQRPKVEGLIAEARATVEEAKALRERADKEADLDGDGKVSGLQEYLAWLSTAGLGAMEIARRKLATAKDAQQAELEQLKAAVSRVETAQTDADEKNSRKRGELWTAIESVKQAKQG